MTLLPTARLELWAADEHLERTGGCRRGPAADERRGAAVAERSVTPSGERRGGGLEHAQCSPMEAKGPCFAVSRCCPFR